MEPTVPPSTPPRNVVNSPPPTPGGSRRSGGMIQPPPSPSRSTLDPEFSTRLPANTSPFRLSGELRASPRHDRLSSPSSSTASSLNTSLNASLNTSLASSLASPRNSLDYSDRFIPSRSHSNFSNSQPHGSGDVNAAPPRNSSHNSNNRPAPTAPSNTSTSNPEHPPEVREVEDAAG